MAPVVSLGLTATTVNRAPTFLFRRIWSRNVSFVPVVLQGRPDHPVDQETLDRKAAMERLGEPANLAVPVHQDHLVRKETTEDPDSLGQRDHLAKMAQPAQRVLMVMRVHPVPLVRPVAKETMESPAPAVVLDHPARQDLPETSQMMALLENPVPLVLPAHLAKMLNTAPARRDQGDLEHRSTLQIENILQTSRHINFLVSILEILGKI